MSPIKIDCATDIPVAVFRTTIALHDLGGLQVRKSGWTEGEEISVCPLPHLGVQGTANQSDGFGILLVTRREHDSVVGDAMLRIIELPPNWEAHFSNGWPKTNPSIPIPVPKIVGRVYRAVDFAQVRGTTHYVHDVRSEGNIDLRLPWTMFYLTLVTQALELWQQLDK